MTGTRESPSALAQSTVGQTGVPHLPGSSKTQERQEEWRREAENQPMKQQRLPGAPSVNPGQEAGARVSEEYTPGRGAKFRAGFMGKDCEDWAVKAASFTGAARDREFCTKGDMALNLCRHPSCGDGSFGAAGGRGQERLVRNRNTRPRQPTDQTVTGGWAWLWCIMEAPPPRPSS